LGLKKIAKLGCGGDRLTRFGVAESKVIWKGEVISKYNISDTISLNLFAHNIYKMQEESKISKLYKKIKN
jgi:hypothetical protein